MPRGLATVVPRTSFVKFEPLYRSSVSSHRCLSQNKIVNAKGFEIGNVL
jgi:hypothetical protein